MALHTELPIYRTGVRLLDLAVKVQVQMPRTVITLALLAACTLAFANNTGHHGPKTPDVKTPPTKPDTSGPKTTPSPAPAARSTPSRDEGQRDVGAPLCSRWPTMFFCDRP